MNHPFKINKIYYRSIISIIRINNRLSVSTIYLNQYFVKPIFTYSCACTYKTKDPLIALEAVDRSMIVNDAVERTRTSTILLPHEPESGM